MEEINEVLILLSKNKVRQIEVITNEVEGREAASRYRAFYNLLVEGAIKTDEEGAAWLGVSANSRKYLRFKNEFKKRLYNTILFIDVNLPHFSEVQRAYYICVQKTAVLKTLKGRGAILSPVGIAKGILPIAEKFGFYDILIETLKIIKNYYSVHMGDSRKFRYYSQLMWKYHELYHAELLAVDGFQEIQSLSINSAANGQEIHELAKKVLARLDGQGKSPDTINYLMSVGLIKVYEKMSINDWAGTIASCRSALEALRSKPFVSGIMKNAFLHQMAAAHLMLGNYETAREASAAALQNTPEGGHNWFKGMEVYLQIVFHEGRYEDAWKAYKQAARQPQFALLAPPSREPWNIYQAYLALLTSLKKITLSPRETGGLKKFRLGKFLNEVPIFSKDKRGLNIPILIIQSLFLLSERRYDDFEDHIECLRKYRSRHFSENDEHFRTECFVRMLQRTVKGDFVRKKVEPRTTQLQQRMRNRPLSLANQTHEIEVVPYERQWEWVLEMLE